MQNSSDLNIFILTYNTRVQIWGMTGEQRLRRQLSSISPDAEIISDPVSFSGNEIVILRDDVVYDPALLRGIIEHKDKLFVNSGKTPVAANVSSEKLEKTIIWLKNEGDGPNLEKLGPAKTASKYNEALRKKSSPDAYAITAENKRDIEWALYQNAYKGVTDIVTKYAWPVPAFHVTRLCARFGISPNMVTSLGAVLMLAALFLFWEGYYGAGLLAGWIMTFLDTVDGKLARVTLTSSDWGNIFDHGIDLIHPPFWYIAWGIGLTQTGHDLAPGMLTPLLSIMFASYVLGRLCEGYFMRRFGMHLHVWRKGDSTFRLISARRNPNMIILTLFWAFQAPDIGLILVTLWHVLTLVIHLFQLVQAEIKAYGGNRITSWLDV